jgi:hypothetical protein
MNIFQLRQYTPELKRIAKKYGIKNLFIFGSLARDESGERSDVDFLVDMKAGSSLFGVGGFSYEAEKLLGVRVDVIPRSVLPKTTDPNFVANIERDAIAL